MALVTIIPKQVPTTPSQCKNQQLAVKELHAHNQMHRKSLKAEQTFESLAWDDILFVDLHIQVSVRSAVLVPTSQGMIDLVHDLPSHLTVRSNVDELLQTNPSNVRGAAVG